MNINKLKNSFLLLVFSIGWVKGAAGNNEKKLHYAIKRKSIDEVKKDSSFLGVLALRLNPLAPFRIMDLGFGLSSISLKKYWLICLGASLPRILWLQFILAGVGISFLKEPKEVIHYLTSHHQLIIYSACYFLAVIVLTFLAVIFKTIQRKGKHV